MAKFTPKYDWLDNGSLISLDYDNKSGQLTAFYRKDSENYFKDLEVGVDYKPFIYLSENSDKYNMIRHTDSMYNLRSLRQSYGSNALFLTPETQFLIQSKYKLFNNTKFSDLKIFVFDIETTSLDPRNGEILAIGVKSNVPLKDGKYSKFFKADHDDKNALISFLSMIDEEDPDIMVGHNVFSFDLPYIEFRMNKHKIPARFGRFNTLMYKDFHTTKVSRLKKGFEFYQYRIPGRYIVDTMHLAIIEDTRRNEFESYSLKYLAQKLKVAPPDRIYIEGSEIKDIYHTDFEKFSKYLEDDLTETFGLTKMFLPAYIQMSKLIPITLQNQIYAGATKKIMNLFIGDYYHAEKSLPKAQPSRDFGGGYVYSEEVGIYQNVAKYDVASLYPSLMRYKNFVPVLDELGVFKYYLIKFMDERLEYKYKAEEVEDTDEKLYEEYFAYQLALKILINSFYGVLGNSYFIFNDYDAAENVTMTGQEIVKKIAKMVKESGCHIIEVDTDGVIFSYPSTVDPGVLIKEVNAEMDEGIVVEFEKRYKSMLCYSDKTYVCLPEDYPKKPLLIKGSAFKKRGMVSFLKKWMHRSFVFFLMNQPEKYEEELFLLKRALATQTLDVEELVESKTISYDYKHYIGRTSGGKIAHFEAMRKEGKEDKYSSGSKVKYYFSGDFSKKKSDMVKLYDEENKLNDYNSDYYISQITDWEKKFEPYYKKLKNETVKSN